MSQAVSIEFLGDIWHTFSSRLEMISIPSGEFLMGSPGTEEGRYKEEIPQHLVRVECFLMGKHPVTQDQWRFVASLPKVNQGLDPDPSYFKGGDRPVEGVSWWDAVEFCDRISQYTGKTYRLPSESEWEYACRAGTTAPYYFGETITKNVVNYESKGTTPINSFPANEWGLYDMHGNVWEWCQDNWHDNYEGAPTDGSAWTDGIENRVLRGGSWFSYPVLCRSAFRNYDGPRGISSDIGFRVVCSAPRT